MLALTDANSGKTSSVDLTITVLDPCTDGSIVPNIPEPTFDFEFGQNSLIIDYPTFALDHWDLTVCGPTTWT